MEQTAVTTRTVLRLSARSVSEAFPQVPEGGRSVPEVSPKIPEAILKRSRSVAAKIKIEGERSFD